LKVRLARSSKVDLRTDRVAESADFLSLLIIKTARARFGRVIHALNLA
jgi:hypothetical protein